jgi:hypothetical protein
MVRSSSPILVHSVADVIEVEFVAIKTKIPKFEGVASFKIYMHFRASLPTSPLLVAFH